MREGEVPDGGGPEDDDQDVDGGDRHTEALLRLRLPQRPACAQGAAGQPEVRQRREVRPPSCVTCAAVKGKTGAK
eukprot:9121069-Heterocapsa_arctica.AAC.1